MDYIIQLSKEPGRYEHNAGTLLALHYMMMKFDFTKFPGRWRPGAIRISNPDTGDIVYVGPDAELINELVGELIDFLNENSEIPIIIKAALAHVNLTMIHSLKDDNGRMARALQTMVLTHDGILSPVFSSIEVYVGHHVLEYYDVLAEVGQGSWHPENESTSWI